MPIYLIEIRTKGVKMDLGIIIATIAIDICIFIYGTITQEL